MVHPYPTSEPTARPRPAAKRLDSPHPFRYRGAQESGTRIRSSVGISEIDSRRSRTARKQTHPMLAGIRLITLDLAGPTSESYNSGAGHARAAAVPDIPVQGLIFARVLPSVAFATSVS
jgi:hypothetical protein